MVHSPPGKFTSSRRGLGERHLKPPQSQVDDDTKVSLGTYGGFPACNHSTGRRIAGTGDISSLEHARLSNLPYLCSIFPPRVSRARASKQLFHVLISGPLWDLRDSGERKCCRADQRAGLDRLHKCVKGGGGGELRGSRCRFTVGTRYGRAGRTLTCSAIPSTC